MVANETSLTREVFLVKLKKVYFAAFYFSYATWTCHWRSNLFSNENILSNGYMYM